MTTTELQAGQKLGPFEIVGRLGAGAMGVVYHARHPQHGELCIKTVKTQGPGQLSLNKTMLRRFKREAEAAKRLDSPYVVKCYGMGQSDSMVYLVQEFVEGGDLEGYLRKSGGRLPIPEALRLAREIACGLASAHSAGLVHRDLKPGNVLLTRDRRAKIGDLGLVLQVEGDPLDGMTVLTQINEALGTPYYMAPEQWAEAHNVDARADLYALGVIIHQMLSGRYPITGKNLSKIMRAHMAKDPHKLTDHVPEAPPILETVILRLLEKDRQDRPNSAELVVTALDRVAHSLGLLGQVAGAMASDKTVVDTGPQTIAQEGRSPTAAASQSGPPAQPPSSIGIKPVAAPGSVMDASKSDVRVVNQDPMVGQLIGGKFQIESVLGKGGMGVVYKAKHKLLGDLFAIKLLLPKFAQDQEFRSRFLREAKVMQSFKHEAAVTLREFGQHQGSLYMALDYVPGVTLAELLRQEGPFDEARTLAIARQVLPCLQEAHGSGLVHRDLKPQNLLIEKTADGRDVARVLDFGIAKVVDDAKAAAMQENLTGTGVTLGTPHYMSPEQDAGDPLDGRSDLYSFACVLYEMLTGRRPIEAQTIQKLRYKIQFESPAKLAEHCPHKLSEHVVSAINSGLAKKREERPDSAVDFLDMLLGKLQAPAVTPAQENAELAPTAIDLPGTRYDGTAQNPVQPLPVAPGRGRAVVVLVLLLLIAVIGAAVVFLTSTKGPIRFLDLPDVELTKDSAPTLRGRLNQGGVSVSIPGTTAKAISAEDGRFEIKVPLREGRNVLSFELLAENGQRDLKNIEITLDSQPPDIDFLDLGNLDRVPLSEFQSVRGRVTDKHSFELSVRRPGQEQFEPLSADAKGRFEISLESSKQAAKYVVMAKDSLGNENSRSFVVVPALTLSLPRTEIWSSTDSVTLTGSTGYGPVTVYGGPVQVNSNDKGEFRVDVKLDQQALEFDLIAEADGQKQTATIALYLDADAPEFVLAGKTVKNEYFVDPGRDLLGKIVERSIKSFTINGEPVSVKVGGRFEYSTKKHKEGDKLKLVAIDKAGNKTEQMVLVSAQVVLEELAELKKVTNAQTLVLKGRVNQAKARVTVNAGEAVLTDEQGGFAVTVKLNDGENVLNVLVEGDNGSRDSRNLPVVLDRERPELTLDGVSRDNSLKVPEHGLLRGQVKDRFGATLTIQGKAVKLQANGRFEWSVDALTGPTKVEIVATDRAGNQRKRQIKVFPPILLKAVKGLKDWIRESSLSLTVTLNYGPAWIVVEDARSSKAVVEKQCDAATATIAVPLNEGKNDLVLRVKVEESEVKKAFVIHRDSQAPKVKWLVDEENGRLVLGPNCELKGQIIDDFPKSLIIDNDSVSFDEQGRFSHVLENWRSLKSIAFVITDRVGQSLKGRVTVETPKARQSQGQVVKILADVKAWAKADHELQDMAMSSVAAKLGSAFKPLDTSTYQCGGQSHRLGRFEHKKTGIVFHLIPGGVFSMGRKKVKNAEPVHEVRISRAFLVAAHEVSQAQWERAGGQHSSKNPGPRKPVENISWGDAQKWLQSVGDGLRMLSESEWEYACRAGTSSRYYWGKSFDQSFVRHLQQGQQVTHDITAHSDRANAFGLVDMIGNVREWVEDAWIDSYQTGPATEKAREARARTNKRTLRGAGFVDKKKDCHSAFRANFIENRGYKWIGLRVAKSLDD